METFPRFRMPKFQPFRMQIEPFGRLSVEGIAHDGAVQAIGVGGMDAELVGAACDRMKEDFCCAVRIFVNDFIFGESRFSLNHIHLLARTLVVVRGKWKGYGAALTF